MGGSFSGRSRRYRSINSFFFFFFLLCFHRSGTADCPPAAHPLTAAFQNAALSCLLPVITLQAPVMPQYKFKWFTQVHRQGSFVCNTHVSGGKKLYALFWFLSQVVKNKKKKKQQQTKLCSWRDLALAGVAAAVRLKSSAQTNFVGQQGGSCQFVLSCAKQLFNWALKGSSGKHCLRWAWELLFSFLQKKRINKQARKKSPEGLNQSDL